MAGGLTMGAAMASVRRQWHGSRAYRAVLIGAGVYVVLRVLVQAAYLATLASGTEIQIPNDLNDYLEAARHLIARQDLYLSGPLERVEFYQYSPAFALLFTAFVWIPPVANAVIHTLLHFAAYGLLYLRWAGIFRRAGLGRAEAMLAWTLPVWLMYSAFWGDLGYLNIYVIVALLATLLIEAILEEHLGWAALWLTLILVTKPHWAFPALLPLLLGRRQFFLRLIGTSALAYASLAVVTILAVGLDYGWRQYLDYFRFLAQMRGNFPWRTAEDGFLGYNHSITQIAVFWLGRSPQVLLLATGIKLTLLAPLALVIGQHLARPVQRRAVEVPGLSFDLLFALYLGAFIWLDFVWELSLGIVVFTYLLASVEDRRTGWLIWVVVLPYALLDAWQLISYLALGDAVMLPGLYIATDPSIYAPVIMIVNLVLYAVLVRRLRAGEPLAAGVPASQPG